VRPTLAAALSVVTAFTLPGCGSGGDDRGPAARTDPFAGAAALNSPQARHAEVVAVQIRPTLIRVLGSRWRGIAVTGDGTIHVRTGYPRGSDPNAATITAACQAVQPAISGRDPVEIEAQDGGRLKFC
jgi:hypothetical protein